MPTIQELYQELNSLYTRLELIYTDLQTAKIRCEQAGETPEALNTYLNTVSKILGDNEHFINYTDAKAKGLWDKIFIKSKNFSMHAKILVTQKRNEYDFKFDLIEKHIKSFLKVSDRDISTFKNNLYSLHENDNVQHLVANTTPLTFLPNRLSKSISNNLFSAIIATFETSDNCVNIVKLFCNQRNEGHLIWDNLSYHFKNKNIGFFKNTNIPIMQQNPDTCFYTSCDIVFSHANKIPYHKLPFYPSDVYNPTTEFLLTPVSDAHNLSVLRAKNAYFYGINSPAETIIRNDILVPQSYNLDFVSLEDDLGSKWETVTTLLKKNGPLAIAYTKTHGSQGVECHAVVLTGFIDQKNTQNLLYTNPHYPGQTFVESKDLLNIIDNFRPFDVQRYAPHLDPDKKYYKIFAPCEKTITNEHLVLNPHYDSEWYPKENGKSFYYGVNEFRKAFSVDQQNDDMSLWIEENFSKGSHNNGLWNRLNNLIPYISKRQDQIKNDRYFIYNMLVKIALETAARRCNDQELSQFSKKDLFRIRKLNAFDIFSEFGMRQNLEKKPYSEDIIFKIRFELVKSLAEQDDFQKIIEINQLPAAELIEKNYDQIIKFYPELKNVPAPIKTPKSTKLPCSFGVPSYDDIALFVKQTGELGGMVKKGAVEAKNRLTTHVLTQPYRYHPTIIANNADHLSRVFVIANQTSAWTGEALIKQNQAVNNLIDHYQKDNSNPLTYAVNEGVRAMDNGITALGLPLTQIVGTIASTPAQLDHWAYGEWRNFLHGGGAHAVLGNDGGAFMQALAGLQWSDMGYYWTKIQGHDPDIFKKADNHIATYQQYLNRYTFQQSAPDQQKLVLDEATKVTTTPDFNQVALLFLDPPANSGKIEAIQHNTTPSLTETQKIMVDFGILMPNQPTLEMVPGQLIQKPWVTKPDQPMVLAKK